MQNPIFSLSSQQPARQLYDYLHNRVKKGNAGKEVHMPTDSHNAHTHTHTHARARVHYGCVAGQLEPKREPEPRAQGHGLTFATSTFGGNSTFGGFGGSPHILRNTPCVLLRTAMRPSLVASNDITLCPRRTVSSFRNAVSAP